jgi:hypothetical protein
VDVKEHPILFSAPMVRAILAGRKTQTRRVLKPQPPEDTVLGPEVYTSTVTDRHGEEVEGPEVYGIYGPDGDWGQKISIQPGDLLWVKEAWIGPVGKNADGVDVYSYASTNGERRGTVKWGNPRFMPRIASRITLRVTDVRVQCLQEISAEDAVAEGLVARNEEPGDPSVTKWGLPEWEFWQCRFSPIDAFEAIWDSINAERAPWASNPWVVAYTFKRVTP